MTRNLPVAAHVAKRNDPVMRPRSRETAESLSEPKVARSLLVAYCTCLVFPFNAAVPNSIWRLMAFFVMLSALSQVIQLGTQRWTKVALAAGFLILGSTALTVPERLVSVALLLAAGVVGWSAGNRAQSWRLIFIVLAASLLTAGLGFFTRIELVNSLPIELRVEYPNTDLYRATGLMGHPLLSGFTVLVVACGLFVLGWRKAPGASIALLGAVGGAAAIFTGTRSVLLCTTILVAIPLLYQVVTGRLSPMKRTSYVLAAGLSGLLGWQVVSQSSNYGLRALDIFRVSNEASYTARAGVLTLLERAEDATVCGGLCEVVGRGFRRSTDIFANLRAGSLVRTFDNSFVTAFFDFGWVGLLLLGALFVAVVPMRIEFAMRVWVIILLVVPALFFDSVYSISLVAGTAFVVSSLGNHGRGGLE